LANNDNPEAIKVIQSLLTRSFPPGRGTHRENLLVDPDETMDMVLEDLQPVHAMASRLVTRLQSAAGRRTAGMKLLRRININGVTYCCANSHIGNSVIQYYPQKSSSALVVGEIEYIIIDNGTTYLTIRRHQSIPLNTQDPFAKYNDFPGRLYSIDLMEPEAIKSSQVRTHAARLQLAKKKLAVIVPLNRY